MSLPDKHGSCLDPAVVRCTTRSRIVNSSKRILLATKEPPFFVTVPMFECSNLCIIWREVGWENGAAYKRYFEEMPGHSFWS